MDRLANDYSNRLQVFKLDLDANKGLAKRLSIRSIPAVMMFRKGELLETLVGVTKYEEFTEAVRSVSNLRSSPGFSLCFKADHEYHPNRPLPQLR
jgi:thioredoxin 1